MKSLFRDHKYVILGLFVLFLLIPIVTDLTVDGEFDPYGFVDAMARRIVWFAFLMFSLYYLDLAVLRVQIGRGFVKQIAGALQRKNGKRAAILDLRDARKLLASAEAAVLAGETEYAIMVADHVRSDRRDLFQKHPILRYEYARTMLILELLRESIDEARRHLAALIRSQKELTAIGSYLRDPEQQLFQACIRLLENPSEEEVQKIRGVPREGLTPIRQALGLRCIIRHYGRIGDAKNRDEFIHSLNRYTGDAPFLKEAETKDNWVAHFNMFSLKTDPITLFRFTAAIAAAMIGISTVLEILTSLRHGEANVVGWTVAGVFALGLGIFGSVRPVKTLARIGVLTGILFLVFVSINLFDFYPLTKIILSDPIEQAEEVSGVDFMLDGGIESIGQSYDYEIVQILHARITFGSPTSLLQATEIAQSGLFITKSAMISAFGSCIPDVVETNLEDAHTRYMLVNLTEETVNAFPGEEGIDTFVLMAWNSLDSTLTCYRYINL